MVRVDQDILASPGRFRQMFHMHQKRDAVIARKDRQVARHPAQLRGDSRRLVPHVQHQRGTHVFGDQNRARVQFLQKRQSHVPAGDPHQVGQDSIAHVLQVRDAILEKHIVRLGKPFF